MKRITAAFLAALLCMSLAACNSDSSESQASENDTQLVTSADTNETEEQPLPAEEDGGEEDEDIVAVPEEMEQMETDAATLNMLIHEAVHDYKEDINTITWNGKTADEATVSDVCVEGDMDDKEGFYTRNIEGNDYILALEILEDNGMDVKVISAGASFKGIELTGEEKISDIAELTRSKVLSSEQMIADADSLNSFVWEAINAYNEGDLETTWNGKTAADSTVHDVCAENAIDDPNDFYACTIDGKEYQMIFDDHTKTVTVNDESQNLTGVDITKDTKIADLAKVK